MHQKPKIVSFFQGSLSRLEWVCINSFVKMGYTFELYVCNEIKAPVGVTLKDAGKFIDCNNILYYGAGAGSGKGSPSLTSNLFRYRILSTMKNACWVDTDMMCLKEFVIENDYLMGYERSGIINSAILGVGKNGDINRLYKQLDEYTISPFKLNINDNLKVTLKKLAAILHNKRSWSNVPWGVTGPLAVTSMVKKNKLKKYAEDCEVYYPIKYKDADKLFTKMSDAEYEKRFINAKTCHLWNEVLRSQGIDKNKIFHKDSPYERIIETYNLDAKLIENE